MPTMVRQTITSIIKERIPFIGTQIEAHFAVPIEDSELLQEAIEACDRAIGKQAPGECSEDIELLKRLLFILKVKDQYWEEGQ